MNEGLETLKDAMDAGDFDTARKLATGYVNAHPDEFREYKVFTEAAESDAHALDQVVADVDHFRSQGRLESQFRAEAWHLHMWHPQQIGDGGQSRQPQRRNHN
jgi:hypothetical protein